MKRFFQLIIITVYILFLSGCCTIDKTQFPTQRNFQSDMPGKIEVES